MKTYDERIKAIGAKARRRKIVSACIKTAASTLCLVAIIIGLMHIPYGSSNVGVNPTNPTNRPTVTNPPTMTTVPTVPTVPTTKPTDPIATIYPTVPTVPTEPSSTATAPIEYPPEITQVLDSGRMQLIKDSWAAKNMTGFDENLQFCNPGSGVDGIRFYGSYTKVSYSGETIRYDILYVPCQALPVASQLTFAGHTFRSWNGFGLYVFSSRYMGITDSYMKSFYPLADCVNENGVSMIEEEVLATALQMHNIYESLIYGSVLTQMPEENPADDLLRAKAAWLLLTGEVPEFDEKSNPRYYGSFHGYHIIFHDIGLCAVQTRTIGGETFSHYNRFELYAVKDWTFYSLEEVFDQGLVSQEDIVQLAKIHQIASNPKKALEEINELFGNLASWYNRAIVSGYSDPTQIDLELLFYAGFDGESKDPTDEEWEQLKDQRGFHEHMNLMRLPADKMNQVLMDLFGITLEDVDDAGFKNLVYLESTGCYYHMVTDFACVENFQAKDIEINANGTISVYYTANWGTEYKMTLVWHGEGYRILSNEICPLEVLP